MLKEIVICLLFTVVGRLPQSHSSSFVSQREVPDTGRREFSFQARVGKVLASHTDKHATHTNEQLNWKTNNDRFNLLSCRDVEEQNSLVENC